MANAKLALKKPDQKRTLVRITDNVFCGGEELLIIGGPCAVENIAQMERVVSELPKGSIQALRGCIYKPRTSPYSFQKSPT